MANYTFFNLSPAEFEDLCRDLLQKKLGVQLESFTAGRDNGIDLRYSLEQDSKAIVQCKRYTAYRSLLSNLKKEAKKLPNISPSRYLLCTSVGLTPSNKDEIIQLLYPYIKNTEDIIGATELNGLLRDYKDVESNHFKLWFGSTQVLEQLLSNRILSRSSFTEEEIRMNTCVYVPTTSFTNATEILKKYKYVVISGIPGIGKTTLARMIAMQFLTQEYSFIDVSFDINEAHDRFGREDRQVFYYDDFLGRNFLEEGLHKNEDRRLLNFIKRIRKSKNKILLMTTREYILRQAKQKYELFKDGDLDLAKCIVDVEDYNKMTKAKILYNHLFFSGLSQEYIKGVKYNRNYKRIIEHQNYNPRLIQLMTNSDITGIASTKDFIPRFIHVLEHPSRIWEDAFHSQITHESRMALYLLTLSLRTICERDLFTSLFALLGIDGKLLTDHMFHDVLRELESTFISISRDRRGTHWVMFANPSIYDFMIEELRREIPIQELCVKSARFFNHLLDVFTFPSQKYILSHQIVLNKNLVEEVENRIVENFELLGELETKGSIWKRSRLERVAQLSCYFPPTVHPKIKHLCIQIFNDVIIDERLSTSDKEALIDLLSYMGDYIKRDHKEIIASFYDTMEDSRDAACFSKLGDFDVILFSDFCFDNEESIYDRIKDLVENTVDNGVTTTEEIDAVLEDIETIEMEFTQIDFKQEKERLEEDRQEIEADIMLKGDYDYDQWKGETGCSSLEPADLNDEIDNLFNSLNISIDE